MESTIIAELICSPVGEGVSVSKYVRAAIKALREIDGIKMETHPMGTIFEAKDLDTIFTYAKIAHEAIFAEGAQRVVTQLRIDDRRDIERTMKDKVEAVKD